MQESLNYHSFEVVTIEFMRRSTKTITANAYLETLSKGSHKLCTEINSNGAGHASNKSSKNSSIPSQGTCIYVYF